MKMFFRNIKKKNRREDGAVVIEATLSLTFFMFMIIALLSIVNICIAQAGIGSALNQTAKEISQYSYFYTLSGINSIQAENYENVQPVKKTLTSLTDEAADVIVTLKEFGSGDANVGETWDDLMSSGDAISETIAEARDNSQWVIQFIKLCGNELYEEAKGQLVSILARGLIQKHLVVSDVQKADGYLKALGVVDGVKGLDFGKSVIFQNGSDNLILVCEYKIRTIDFFGWHYDFSFCQVARTKIWDGKSLLETSAGEIGESIKDPRSLTGEELEAYMVRKYGQGAIDELKAQYGDDVANWTYEDWEYYIYLYAAHDPNDPRTMTSAQLKQYMIDKYGEGAVKDICASYDTSNWEYDDWEYYIYLYAADPLPFSFKNKSDYNEYIHNIGRRTDLTDEEKINLIQEAYSRLENKTGVNALSNTDNIVGFDPKTGNPIYEGESNGNQISDDDRAKINKWNYTPSDELYTKYKSVYDDSHYFNQSTGEVIWPPNDGFVAGQDKPVTLPKDTVFKRYGASTGNFLGNETDPFEKRSLAPFSDPTVNSSAEVHYYKLVEDYTFVGGPIAPWFGQDGGGVQYLLYKEDGSKYTVDELINEGILIEVTDKY